MVAIATPVAQVTDLATLSPTAQAAALGLPALLQGLTPAQDGYWYESGLPWWTEALRENPPLDYRGYPLLPFTAWIEGNRMAPRFPDGTGVMLAPVGERKNLVLGKVYTYTYQDSKTGEQAMTMGRLVKIGGNYLEVVIDNPCPTEADRTIWLLRDNEQEAVWDVREVTHYVSYPSEAELQGGQRE
jgi:hypothetical protein